MKINGVREEFWQVVNGHTIVCWEAIGGFEVDVIVALF